MNTSIKNWDYKEYTYYINGVAFVLNADWQRIAISVSGGADSALLAYLLIRHIELEELDIEVHIISNVRMWKTRPWQRYNSLQVYDWLKTEFPDVKIIRHEGFIAPDIEYGCIGPSIKDEYGQMKSGDQITARSYSEYICYSYNIQAIYAGMTTNPQGVGITKGMPDREPNTVEDLIQIVNGIHVCHPFRHTTKDWIVRQYTEYGIMDLFHITRSCEGEFADIDYTNYTPGQHVPTCEKCFWCQERNWALSQ